MGASQGGGTSLIMAALEPRVDKIKCPVKMQVSLRDSAAPADCAFAAYNRITAPKSVKVNPFGEHGDIDLWQWMQELSQFSK